MGKNYIVYNDTRAHVIEVLTKKVDNSYKAFLRKLGISYIVAEEDGLSYELLLEKKTIWYRKFNVRRWRYIKLVIFTSWLM